MVLAAVETLRFEFDSNDPVAVRHAARRGILTRHTAALAPAYVQANVVILPEVYASDFLAFCQRNPKPCPLLAVSEPGVPRLPELAEDLDLRSDLPRYRIWRDGEMVEDVPEISHLWRDDLVAFAIGCSLSFERALLDAGLRLHHVERDEIVPMYLTSIATRRAGPFRGPMVVSMRAFRPAAAIRAIQITTRFPSVHGAPVHIGLPHLIGIADLAKPDFGPPRAHIEPDELPLFWGCGVTPQAAVRAARPPLCITHTPGHMLVTDVPNASLAAL